jgi:uncharacterized membrane protein YtjA (UPF0391 family)
MLSWPLAFLIIALLAALLGFTGIAGSAAWMAKAFFALFLVLFLASITLGRKRTSMAERFTKESQ